MKFLKFSLIVALSALFIFSCSRSNAPANNSVTTSNGTVINTGAPTASYNSAPTANGNDELASAQKIYEEKCIKCHKADGTGGVTDFDGTKIKAPNLTSERMKNDKDADWIDTIENGAKEDGMPAFKGKISDDDIKNLVKYIRKNFQGKAV